MLRIAYSQTDFQKMVQNIGKLFCAIFGWLFFGDVLEFYFGSRRNRYSGDFGEMEQHRMQQTDCAKDRTKVGEAVFMDSWIGVFRGYFKYYADLQKILFYNRV